MISFFKDKVPPALAWILLAITSAAATPPEDLGEPVGAVIAQGVAFGHGWEGANEFYFATNGSPATFYAVNAETLEVTFSAPLPGLDVVWAITTGSDGRVYFAGTRNGRIYRYCQQEQAIHDLGTNGTNDIWVWDLVASEDGKVYGSTYPGASVFEVDIENGASKPFVNELTREQYARGLGVTPEHVYVCVATRAHLFRVDRQTGESTEIAVPNRGNPGSSISRAWVYGGRILARSGGSRLFVLDEETHEVIRGNNNDHLTFSYSISPPAPHNPDLIYYKDGDALFTYNLTTDQVERVPATTPLTTNPMRGWAWIELREGDQVGRTVLAGLSEFGEFIRYDPADGSLRTDYPKVEPQGVLIQALETAPDGLLYLGGYQGGMSAFDTQRLEVVLRHPQFNQPEGIGFLGGEIFFGTYSSAKIYRYRPNEPFNFGHTPEDNPGLDFVLGHSQDRPFVLVEGDEKLFVGSVPGYGLLGGSLAIMDPAAESGWTVHRNVIPDQSIIGLAYRDGKLYGSTSVFGGLGSTPSADAAVVFIWDVEKSELVRTTIPEIPNIDQTPRAIGALSFGPDGKLWAAAGGTLAVLDPDTLEVERARTIHPSNWNLSHYWRPVYLRWGGNGKLYTTLGRKLTVVDPKTFDFEVLDDTSLMTLGHDGYIYYAKGSRLYRLPAE